MRRKGFTLIELLAVIVIIAIIALVTIPLIGRVIENSKKGALTVSASGIIEAAEIYYSTKMMENPETKTFTCSNEGCISGEEKLDYKGQVTEGRVILYADGKVSICIEDGTNASLKLAEQSEITTEEGSCNYESEDYSIDATVSKAKYNELQEELNKTRSQLTKTEEELSTTKEQLTNAEGELNNTKKQLSNTEEELNNIKTEVTNGKDLLATAITNKGVSTTSTQTFSEMATNIGNITTGDISKEQLYDALQYSQLVTENMSAEEMLKALSGYFPELEPQMLIPNLISNTSASGIVISASSVFDSNYASYLPFSTTVTGYGAGWVVLENTYPLWLQIYFETARIVTSFEIKFTSPVTSTVFVLQGSNDGTTWNNLTNQITATGSNTLFTYDVTINRAYYHYYRINIITQTLSSSVKGGRVGKLQLYGA